MHRNTGNSSLLLILKILSILPPLILAPRFCYPLKLLPCFIAYILLISITNYNTEFTISSQPIIIIETNGFNCTIVTLTLFITYIIFLVRLRIKGPRSMRKNVWNFNYTTLILLYTVIVFFITDNIMLLYIIFELSLIPTLIIILKWGYQPERLQARFYFVIYTICASLPLLYVIVFNFNQILSLSITTTDFLPNISRSNYISTACFLLAFLVKLPIWGVHLWLPKAHVEAPVSGSIVLAGILLKLGGYGLIKMILLIPNIRIPTLNMFISINLWGALIIRMVCLVNIDIKVIVAYSSIVHINLIVLGILRKNNVGIYGAIYIIIAHGISSPAMFSLVNINYMKTHTRNILIQKGIGTIQPQTNLAWFVLISVNMAVPPTLNLIREIIITTRILKISSIFIIPLCVITVLSGAYNLYIFSAQQGSAQHKTPSTEKSSSSEYLINTAQIIITIIIIIIIPLIT